MKKAKLFMMLALLVMGVSNLFAQNVTISPKNGSMIGSSQSGIGWQLGSFATWKHNQLSLTMTCSNSTALTEDGQFQTHENHYTPGNLLTYSHAVSDEDASNYISAAWGSTGQVQPGYIIISLPKGYRFTGYTFLLSNDVTGIKGQNYNPVTTSTFYMEETDKSFNTTIKQATIPRSQTNVVTFERTGNDMSNVLYFKTRTTVSGYCELLFRYVELTFTADADTEIELAPGEQMTIDHTLVEIPFKTGKVDFGQISSVNGRYTYQYNNTEDMSANMLLYQEESVTDGTAHDGTSGKVAFNQVGSITTAVDYFKLTTPNKEQVYYLETPVYATMNDANQTKNPIHYRITGAEIDYINGFAGYDQFTIRGRQGNRYDWNYMGIGSGIYNSGQNWFMDENGYVRCGNNGANYLKIETKTYYVSAGFGSRRSQDFTYLTTTTNREGAVKFKKGSNNTLQVLEGAYANYYVCYGTQTGYTSSTSYDQVTFYWRVLSTNNRGVELNTVSGKVGSLPNCEFTLKVYDKTGTTVESGNEVTVNSNNPSGKITLTNLNNDAIKFSVQGTGYVKLKLTVQALSPYIDQMSVVLNDVTPDAQGTPKNIHMKQSFTSDDFSVGGDEFDFYLPTDCQNDNVTITFEDLYSRYGDDTYDHVNNMTPGNSRYSYVKSAHFNAFTGDNIYSTAGKAEAASDTKETARIAAENGMIRTQVGIAGSVAFKFNNADELSTSAGRFTEYPFTVAKYGDSNFKQAVFNGLTNTQTKTFYVFTTDETRYNIAPTTATQHRFYAFYEMKVNIHLADYTPTVQFEKVYDKTFYVKDGVEVGGTTQDPQPMYGAIVTAPIPGTNKIGLASPYAMKTAIDNAITAGGVNVPTSADQILYVDMHQVGGTYETSDLSFANFKNALATNALMYLPQNATSTLDNFATKTPAGYRAAHDIIVTDKAPFFAPYDISVDAANAAVYERGITWPQNKTVAQATVVLPFTITIDENGLHENPDGTSLNLYHMQPNKSISLGDGTSGYEYDYGIGYFTNIGENFFEQVGNTRVAKANTPYMVFVNSGKTNEKSFDIVSRGAMVKATTDNGVFTGESSVAEDFDGTTGSKYKFTSKASYTGEIIENARENANVFYFAGGYFLNSSTLKKGLSLYVYPFRTYYAYTSNQGAKVQRFMAVFGENPNMGGTNGISEIERDADLAVIPGKGEITLMAKANKEVKIHAVNGQTVDKCSLNAGETRTVAVPAGVYVINGVKMVVK